MPKTRSVSVCPIFGGSAKLVETMLPTYKDVLKYFFYTRETMTAENGGRTATVHQTAARVAKKVVEIWHRASILTSSETYVKLVTIRYYEKYRQIHKSASKVDKSKVELKKIDVFDQTARKLFDICTCKCTNIHKCQC